MPVPLSEPHSLSAPSYAVGALTLSTPPRSAPGTKGSLQSCNSAKAQGGIHPLTWAFVI